MRNPALKALDQAFIKAYAPDRRSISEQDGVDSLLKSEPAPVRAVTIEVATAAATATLEEPLVLPLPVAPIVPPVEAAPLPSEDALLPPTILPLGLGVDLPSRPLSSFTLPAAPTPFAPQLEVDSFAWPDAVTQLTQRAPSAVQTLVDHLLANLDTSQRLVAIAGCRRGEGRSTLVATLAKVLAPKCKVAIVDCDFTHPNLSKQLGLEVSEGLEQVLGDRQTLAEVAVTSLADRVTLIPLCGAIPAESRLPQYLRGAVALNLLRENYDLVLLDTGPANPTPGSDWLAWCTAIHLDATYLLMDGREQKMEEVYPICNELVRSGLVVGGIIENYSPMAQAQRPTTLRVVSNDSGLRGE